MKIPLIDDCPKCGRNELRFIPSDGKPHHGRFVCGNCDAFRGWVSKDVSKFIKRLVLTGVAHYSPSNDTVGDGDS